MEEKIEKKCLFLEAMIRFTEIFGNENIGDCEVDIAKIINYSESKHFNFIMSWECETLDDFYKLIENMILEGFPIWHFLKISDWTKNIFDKEFEKEIQTRKQSEELEKSKYKCYKCKWIKETQTSLGLIFKCDKPENKIIQRRYGRLKPESFEPKKRCKDFINSEGGNL